MPAPSPPPPAGMLRCLMAPHAGLLPPTPTTAQISKGLSPPLDEKWGSRQRAYKQAAFLANDEEERANCARAVIGLFRSGVTDEATLVAMAAQHMQILLAGKQQGPINDGAIIDRIWDD